MLYTELAWLYDRLYPRIFDYPGFLRLIDPVLKEHRARRVLEAACGTGRLMELLEGTGYEVTGLDLSAEMLKIASKRCRGRLIQSDIRNIPLQGGFDAVTCLGRSFCYMLTDRDVDAALDSFSRCLEPGGTLVFDAFDVERVNPCRFGEWIRTVYRLEGTSVRRSTLNEDWDPQARTWKVTWQYEVKTGHRIRVYKDEAWLRAFSRLDLAEKLRKHGFTAIEAIGERELTLKAVKEEP